MNRGMLCGANGLHSLSCPLRLGKKTKRRVILKPPSILPVSPNGKVELINVDDPVKAQLGF